jgi:hypothetical protein
MAIIYVCHNSQYWKMAITLVMACIWYGNKYGLMGVFLKSSKNADQQRKQFLKI